MNPKVSDILLAQRFNDYKGLKVFCIKKIAAFAEAKIFNVPYHTMHFREGRGQAILCAIR